MKSEPIRLRRLRAGFIDSVNDNITMNRKWKIKMYKNDH